MRQNNEIPMSIIICIKVNYHLRKFLPIGQFFLLQAAVCVESPGQFSPLQTRVLCFLPEPQVCEHSEKGLHSDQAGTRKQIITLL